MKNQLLAILFAQFLLVFGAPAFSQTYWTGAGPTDEYDSSANWSNGAPDSVDEGVFDIVGMYYVGIHSQTSTDDFEFKMATPYSMEVMICLVRSHRPSNPVQEAQHI